MKNYIYSETNSGINESRRGSMKYIRDRLPEIKKEDIEAVIKCCEAKKDAKFESGVKVLKQILELHKPHKFLPQNTVFVKTLDEALSLIEIDEQPVTAFKEKLKTITEGQKHIERIRAKTI